MEKDKIKTAYLKRICIFLFSGTGMTEYVISKIRLELEKQLAHVDVYTVEAAQIQNMRLDAYDAIGIAYPVHAFNAPRIVIDLARRLPETDALRAFVISTAGADHPVNFASSRLLIKNLRKKGFNVFYDKQFVMPSNFVLKYDEQQVEKLIENVKVEIPRTAQEIINCASCERKSGLAANIMAFIGRAEWFGAKFMGRSFYADQNCSRCGVCAGNCPNHNIVVGKGRARFKWRCGLCMRCLYLCPKHAIKVHPPFKFISFTEWYPNDELLAARSGVRKGEFL